MVGAGFYKEATPTEFRIGATQIGFWSKPKTRQPTPGERLAGISTSSDRRGCADRWAPGGPSGPECL
jgi:hypothetical protein